MKTKGRTQSRNIEDRRPTVDNIIWADKVVQFRNESFEVARKKTTPLSLIINFKSSKRNKQWQ